MGCIRWVPRERQDVLAAFTRRTLSRFGLMSQIRQRRDDECLCADGERGLDDRGKEL
jgi:hypothetical protein